MNMVQRLGVFCLLLALAGCGHEHGANVVGDQCLPDAIPSALDGGRGFFSGESYLQRSSPACQGHACIVHRLDNGSDGGLPADPTVLCDDQSPEPGCVTSAALEQSVHCTCQCAGAGSGDKYCTCPSGFACRELSGLGFGAPTERPGSFCVRPARTPSSLNRP